MAPKQKRPWSDRFYVRIYVMARAGLDLTKIASGIGVSSSRLSYWIDHKAALRWTIKYARKKDAFRDYLYEQLSPEAKKTWTKIVTLNEDGDARGVKDLIEQKGKLVQQRLFIFVWLCNNFNASKACQQTGISYRTYSGWLVSDPEFPKLMDEVQWHKQNFYEDALVKNVDAGDPATVLFANRTFNAKRGYNDKQVVEHTGQVNHAHVHASITDISELDLPIEVKMQIRDAIRKKKQQLLTLANKGEVVEGNGTVR